MCPISIIIGGRVLPIKAKHRRHAKLDNYFNSSGSENLRDRVRSLVESLNEVKAGSSNKNTSLNNDSLSDIESIENTNGWTLGDIENFVEEFTGYLLDVRYDGRINKAISFLIGDDGRIIRWIDRTGHRPYFLTDADPESLKSMGLDPESNKLIVQFDLVSKFHPIRREKVKLYKVIASDPLAVKKLRSIISGKGFSVWEADIKYHHNYIFDNLLVPGMRYRVSRRWERDNWSIDPSFSEEVQSITIGESREYKDMAYELALIFEQRPPKIRRVAVDIEIYTPEYGKVPDPDKATYPVISIALADTDGRVKVLLLYRDNASFNGPISSEVTEVEIFDSESALLLEFFREIEKYPVILTFNGDSFDLPYIYNRLIVLGLDPMYIPIEFHEDKVTLKYSLHVDLYKLFSIKALQAYAFGGRYRELKLENIAESLLGISKVKLEDTVSNISLEKLVEYNARDAIITVNLTTFSNELVWNLILMVMRISKLGLEDVTRHQVSTWIRGLMNWEHRRRGWLIPNKDELKAGEARSRAIIKDKRYKGAIVLEPPQGIFFNVIVLDYASLYPSIIKNWNLSYETINNPKCSNTRIIPEVGYEVCIDYRGITSEVVGLLRDYRVKIYKRKAKDEKLTVSQRLWYDTVQSALKVYINASYGVFGNEAFPFYSLPVAESVTAIGRSILLDTLKVAKSYSLHIVYGDTDSIFLWDPKVEALDYLTKYVVDKHSLELEVDKRFKVVLFSGLKKNYLGITDKGEIVIKGMVGKKSNTPEFIKREFNTVVNSLRELDSPESVFKVLDNIREHISEVYRRLKNKGYTLDELAINVMLSKDPGKYVKTTPQHVKAAKLLQREGFPVSKGDIIAYVKTKDPVGVKPVRLAKLSEVDVTKYVEHIKTAFEQILQSFGVKWDELTGQRSLDKLLGLGSE